MWWRFWNPASFPEKLLAPSPSKKYGTDRPFGQRRRTFWKGKSSLASTFSLPLSPASPPWKAEMQGALLSGHPAVPSTPLSFGCLILWVALRICNCAEAKKGAETESPHVLMANNGICSWTMNVKGNSREENRKGSDGVLLTPQHCSFQLELRARRAPSGIPQWHDSVEEWVEMAAFILVTTPHTSQPRAHKFWFHLYCWNKTLWHVLWVLFLLFSE